MRKKIFQLLILVCLFTMMAYQFAHLDITKTSANQTETEITETIILLWTTFFESEKWSILPDKVYQCSERQICYVTTNHSNLNVSHALVFHARDIHCNFPAFRNPSQHWVIFSLESRANELILAPECTDHAFNRSWSYRSDSDANYYYGHFETQLPRRRELTRNNLENKTSMVAWFVSNCETKSRRETYIEILSEFVNVHVLTHGCFFPGNFTYIHCSDEENCDEWLRSYKFYLAFENSFCDDYLTEKVFRAYTYGAIPIVYSGANYSKTLPDHSYIDAQKYSAKDLAALMYNISSDPNRYNSYFAWKETLQVVTDKNAEKGVCDLCGKIKKHWYDKPKTIQTKNDWLLSQTCVNGFRFG